MEIEKVKFLITIYDNKKILHNGEEYTVVIDKQTTSSWKKAKTLIEKLKKKYSKEIYPMRKIVVKEKFREGWKEILKYD